MFLFHIHSLAHAEWSDCPLSVKNTYHTQFQKESLKNLTQTIQSEVTNEIVFFEDLPFLKEVRRSQRKNLLAIEAQQYYIQRIYPDRNYTILCRLKDAPNLIPKESGMRVHRSYWVSFNWIKKLKSASTVILINDKEVPVKRPFSKELKSKI